MCSRAGLFLIGAVYLYAQVIVAEYVFTAELTVASNVTLEANSILLALNNTEVQVDTTTVTLLISEVVAECLIIGDETSCNCSTGYIWSNPVCYNYNCCRETTCAQNVSDSTPLCIAKVNVRIKGSVRLKTPEIWGSIKETQLINAFGVLNGFESLNVTGERIDGDLTVADFEANASVKCSTPKLQGVVDEAKTNLKAAEISVDTVGMVEINSPGKVHYNSVPVMTCTFMETNIKMDSYGWNFFGKDGKLLQLNDGTVAKVILDSNSSALCAQLTLKKVTGIWSGRYECEFKKGSVRHAASTELSVALLPDVVILKMNPLTVDCSAVANAKEVTVNVTATIPVSTENFEVSWNYKGVKKPLVNKSGGGNPVYEFDAIISCEKSIKTDTINVTFKNSMKQEKIATVDVPVIYVGAKFCKEETDSVLWPKTPAGKTMISDECAKGRVGYKSRTCRGTLWGDVFSNCVNAELNKVLDAADTFAKGLGATQKMALDIFSRLFKSSTSDPNSNDSTADISASINVLSLMSKASEFIVLEDSVLPNFVHAASNMLNNTWSGVNTSIVQDMSSKYLQSVEHLGLFILITGVFAEQKVREEMIKLIMAKSKGKSESMKNLTSTTYARDK
ncbi:uncharacterized protein adgrf3b isoform X2 [Notothenia coriiceps]|uniref:Uncharacterized protein adgrf3b isoform X2 n=1 Tax=Notothenia coriiceps TaxID=8208 RepID=A0A6I9PZG8_9TELE|nr:PREDICTED: uncharacterized protein LOC104966099 isoform X2 [Notothenia coriiceps]